MAELASKHCDSGKSFNFTDMQIANLKCVQKTTANVSTYFFAVKKCFRVFLILLNCGFVSNSAQKVI